MTRHVILVADEDQDTRIILRTLLEQRGFGVLEAGTAAAAMAAAQEYPGLVILNHPMNVSENVSLARWLRSNPDTRDVPIINLTSRAVPLLIEEAEMQGVTVTMAKPLDVQSILRLVNELMAPMAAL